MWRELHPKMEVIHVRPVPELVDIELEHVSTNNNTDPIRGVPPLLAARAALAEPVADEPAAGEAGELASLIREAVRAWVAWEEGAVMLNNMTAAQLTRAADMLVQLCSSWFVPTVEQVQQLAPVPVSERLPEPEDCDAEGRCWLFSKVEKEWRLIDAGNPGVPHLKYCFGYWLPANALPLPSEEVK